MANKTTYTDRALIKLHRKYGKDELIQSLEKQLSEKNVEIGQLKSEIDHLTNELTIKQIDKALNDEITRETRKEELYKNILDINKDLSKRNKDLVKLRDELLLKIDKLLLKLNKHENNL
jgi:thiamine phosphate synthase YjbQ (UPF0047 family)